jgi:diguanylate cyclase (GGDEF)-like protein
MLEVDKFKAYNDRYGHQQGDTILKGIAAVLHQQAQAWQGIAARYGGDEFVVILPGRDEEETVRLARLLMRQLEQGMSRLVEERELPTVTVSMGVAASPGAETDAPSLIDAADRAMYRAKTQGGGCICTPSS